jgi:hypothetical protein
MVQAYCRCNNGHYFVGEYCPIDGWSSPASKELVEGVKRLIGTGQGISLAELHSAGVSEDALRQAVVIEFGASESAFDALSPEGYVIKGEWKPLSLLDAPFK